MTSIVRAAEADSQLLSGLAKLTFIESHGNCAGQDDVNVYVAEKCSTVFFKEELSDLKNIYYIIYHDNGPAGYSKISFNTPYTNSERQNITKLERIYLLEKFYNLKLGLQLLQFNIDLSKSHHQMGIWLYVWKENHRAFNFYKKMGFDIIGIYDFNISPTHANPNYQMFLKY